MKALILALGFPLMVSQNAHAVVFVYLDDPFDDHSILQRMWNQHPEIIEQSRQKISNVTEQLRRLKKRDIQALVARPGPTPNHEYAMPVAQSRAYAKSGMLVEKSKSFTEFHVVPGLAGIWIDYDHDGETPIVVLLYWPVKDGPPKLTDTNLHERLTWDDKQLGRLVEYLELQSNESFPWEVDQQALAKLESGIHATRPDYKLAAWIASGRENGYIMRETKAQWAWTDRDGNVVRRVDRNDRGIPVRFSTFLPGRRKQELPTRCETFDPNGQLSERNWPGIRFESRSKFDGILQSWTWYAEGDDTTRTEWDDNGDGIPDWYIMGSRNEARRSNAGFYEWRRDRRKPLSVYESWAINPYFISYDYRIPDQPDLGVPIRKRQSPMFSIDPLPERRYLGPYPQPYFRHPPSSNDESGTTWGLIGLGGVFAATAFGLKSIHRDRTRRRSRWC